MFYSVLFYFGFAGCEDSEDKEMSIYLVTLLANLRN